MDQAVLRSLEEESDGPWDIPEGWAWARLGAVLPIAYGKALPDRDRSGSGEYPVFGSSGPVGSHSEFIAPANSIMVGRKGSAGSVFFSKEPTWPIDTAYFTSGCAAIDIRYGYWFLVFRKLGSLDQSTAIPSLSRDIYNVQQLPLAPLAEQRRIVARVDALFAEIADGEAALDAARKGLDTFRRALLKDAVTGDLTKDWREKNPVTETGHDLLARIRAERAAKGQAKGRGKRSPDAPPLDTAALPELPAGWAWGTLGELSWASSYGTSTKCDANALGVPVLRIPNIRAGAIVHGDMKFATADLGLEPADYVSPGDLLVIRTNGSETLIGRGGVAFEAPSRPTYFASYLIRFRILGGELVWNWVSTFFESSTVRSWMTGQIASSAGQYNVSQSSLALLPVPIPPPAEAAEIRRRVSEALAASADTLAMLDAEAADAARLKQSILKAAFEGRLVPQNPADEPAGVMLARVRSDIRTARPRSGARGRPRKGSL